MHHGHRFAETGEGKTNRVASIRRNIKSSHDHPLPLPFLHHQPRQFWGCCSYLRKQGRLLSSQYHQMLGAVRAQRLHLVLVPLRFNEEWYSPASESACCYGNTSHLACSHPTLLHVSWQWWQKKELQKQHGGLRGGQRKGRKQCSDRHTTLMICCSNKVTNWVIKNLLINGWKVRYFYLSWTLRPTQGWNDTVWRIMTFYRLNKMSYTEQCPSPFLSVPFSLCSRAVQLERGRGGMQKMRSGGKRKTVGNQEWLLNSAHPLLATILHSVNYSDWVNDNLQNK